MSLSKYYKSSNAFQPEELIKREEISAPSGWQISQPLERLPFQTQKIPASSDSENVVHESPAPSTNIAVNEDTTEKGQKSDPDITPPAPPPLQKEIDLSNYIERALADKQIEDAYQKGLNTGKHTVEQEFAAATRALLSACQQLDTIRETIIGNSSEELQKFALAIAERILRISVREQDSTILLTIEEALQRAVKSDEFTVYIHPEDYDTVAKNADEIISGLSGLNKVVIKKDSTLERGGTKIESDNCTIDATITSQLEVIREEIKKNL